MPKMFSFIGGTVGGYAAWGAGLLIGKPTAMVLSIVGTGLGMYYGRKFGKMYL
ncbi:MAG TPA: hypothetical protein VGD02_08115 [Gemmatimonadaceae bacterium]|jgi:hypothetical protein